MADFYRERTIGVVLTGYGIDGSHGVEAIGRMGGYVIAQEPSTAEAPGMPSAAIQTGCVNAILPSRFDKFAAAGTMLAGIGQVDAVMGAFYRTSITHLTCLRAVLETVGRPLGTGMGLGERQAVHALGNHKALPLCGPRQKDIVVEQDGRMALGDPFA